MGKQNGHDASASCPFCLWDLFEGNGRSPFRRSVSHQGQLPKKLMIAGISGIKAIMVTTSTITEITRALKWDPNKAKPTATAMISGEIKMVGTINNMP